MCYFLFLSFFEKYLKFHISDRSFAYTESEPVTEQQTPAQPQSRTAPGRLEAHDTDSEEEHFNLKKVGCLPPPWSMNVLLCLSRPALSLCCYEGSDTKYDIWNNSSSRAGRPFTKTGRYSTFFFPLERLCMYLSFLSGNKYKKKCWL